MSEIIKSIITNLIEATKDGDIDWLEAKSLFSTDTCKKYTTMSSDEKTKFTVEVDLDKDLKFKPQSTDMTLNNKDLIDGIQFLYTREYPELANLGQLIFDKYVKPNLPAKNNNNTLESILDNIHSKQTKRDNKLNEILDDGDSVSVRKESLFDKIFKKN